MLLWLLAHDLHRLDEFRPWTSAVPSSRWRRCGSLDLAPRQSLENHSPPQKQRPAESTTWSAVDHLWRVLDDEHRVPLYAGEQESFMR